VAVKPYEEKTEGSSDSKGKIEVKLHELKSNPESFYSSLKSCQLVLAFGFRSWLQSPYLQG
jgi:hypothetical protein